MKSSIFQVVHNRTLGVTALQSAIFLSTVISWASPLYTFFGQGNVFTGICHSVNRGVSASVDAGIHTPLGADTPLPQSTPPWSRHPSWTRHPPDQTPQTRHPPDQTHPPGTRHIPQSRHPLDQTSPRSRHPLPRTRHPPLRTRHPSSRKHTPAYGQRAAGTHPTGMHSCSILIINLLPQKKALNCN